jgi:predicted acylesterase/phospholipase RssA
VKTTVFCPPGLERGAFALGVLDLFEEREFFVSRIIGASGGSLPAIAYSARATKECIEEYCNFELKSLAVPNEIGKGNFGVHRMPSMFTNDGWRNFFSGVVLRNDLLGKLRASSTKVELLALNLVNGERVVLYPNRCKSADELVEILVASAALTPLWPAVGSLVDGVFAPNYFLNEATYHNERFIICRGDPQRIDLEEGRQFKNWVSVYMRAADIICANRLNDEIRQLSWALDSRVFVLSHNEPLKRVNIFRKSRENILEVVRCGREAAKKFLESRA